jgi:ribonucleoside-diphosphate reductase alpha chain
MSRELPDTLASVVHKIEHSGFELYITTTFHAGPKEVFVTIAREGSTLRGMLHVISMLISVALRAGVPWSELSEKLRRHKFDPVGLEYESIVHAVAAAVDTCVAFYEKEKQ